MFLPSYLAWLAIETNCLTLTTSGYNQGPYAIQRKWSDWLMASKYLSVTIFGLLTHFTLLKINIQKNLTQLQTTFHPILTC